MMDRKNIIVAMVAVFTLVAAGWFVVSKNLQNRTNAQPNMDCLRTGQVHAVVIRNDQMQPETVTAKKCDRLTITNRDDVTREIGFGQHDHHTPYDGVSERILKKGESLTITLNQIGEFHYHDHFHDEVAGNFIVK
jgi:plastocyanin